MDIIVGIALGIGLSAACGFRVFVPLLATSLAAKLGIIPLSSGLEWIGSWPALITLFIATCVEIGAYYVPWIDNALDTIASPAAMIAGTIVAASVIVDTPPLARWALALIAGGGTAGVVQGSTVLIRGTSSATTGGFGNPIVSTVELIASVVTTILTIIFPIVIATIVIIVSIYLLKKIVVFFKRRNVQVIQLQ